MSNNESRIAYKLGYQDGFEDGLIAARMCANCEYISKCQDDPQKTDYCPNAKLRERTNSIESLNKRS
jgi:hypothetical protein